MTNNKKDLKKPAEAKPPQVFYFSLNNPFRYSLKIKIIFLSLNLFLESKTNMTKSANNN